MSLLLLLLHYTYKICDFCIITAFEVPKASMEFNRFLTIKISKMETLSELKSVFLMLLLSLLFYTK